MRAMRGWLRNGLIAGAVSATATLLIGLLRGAIKSDYCQAGIVGVGHPSAVDIGLNLSGLAVLLLVAGAAGRQSAAASKGKAGLVGLITGTISGIGTLALNILQFDQYTICMVRGGIAGAGMDMRPTLLIMAVVAIAIGTGLAAIASSLAAAITRRT
jgi:hypothetical protein